MKRILMMFALLGGGLGGAMACDVGDGVGGPALPDSQANAKGKFDSSLVESHAAALTNALAEVAPTPYVFPLPDGWFPETDPLPPPWNRTFPFSGTEEVRFLPGFGDGTSIQNFSYTYLLWIDQGPAITAASLSSALLGYYQGLVCGDPSYPCDASGFRIGLRSALKTRPLEIMTGSISMLDFAQLPITLNFFVSSLTCPGSHHRAVLVSASPQTYNSTVWNDLLQSQLHFRCQ